MHKALLFLNGVPPATCPELSGYNTICCTDGALNYLPGIHFPMEKLSFVSGDLDSVSATLVGLEKQAGYPFDIIQTPDQDKTDFEKILEILRSKNIDAVDIYGGSGGEMDHFLGNLTVAFRYQNPMNLIFFDAYGRYFFARKNLMLSNVNRKMISLFPFPTAENVSSDGLRWELKKNCLSSTGMVSTRNVAVKDVVQVTFTSGNLIVFVGN